MGSYPGLFEWILNVITGVCKRETQKRREDRRRAGKGKAEIRVMQLQAEEHQQPPKTGRGKEQILH